MLPYISVLFALPLTLRFWVDFKFYLVLIYSVIFLASLGASNLICNGDFQVYNLTGSTNIFLDGSIIYHGQFAADANCWYRKTAGMIQVQTQTYAHNTKTAELAAYDNVPFTLCQSVTLPLNRQFSLSVSMVKPKYVTSATGYVYLNGAKIGQGTSSDYLISVKVSYNFTSAVNDYQICINGTILKSFQSLLFAQNFTPLIDNVTLFQIISTNIQNSSNTSSTATPPISIAVNTTVSANNTLASTNTTLLNPNSTEQTNVSINKNLSLWGNNTSQQLYFPPSINASIINFTDPFQMLNPNISGLIQSSLDVTLFFQQTVNDEQGYFQLQCFQPISLDLFNAFSKNFKLYVERELQRNVQFQLVNNMYLHMKVYVQRTYDLKTIQILFPKQILQNNVKIYIKAIINGQPVNIYVLSDNFIQAVQSAQTYSTLLSNAITKTNNVLKTFFCSYFIFNLINFYSLTLLYNFLTVPSKPVFTHNTLQKIFQIFYIRNGLFRYIDTFSSNISSDRQQKQYLSSRVSNNNFVNTTGDRERVTGFKNNFSWFGSMGISYNFITNNLETLFLLAILIFKLILLKFICYVLPNLMIILFGNCFDSLLQIFFMEFICLSPLITISGFQTILNGSYFQYQQRANMVLHIIMQYSIIISPFILFYIFNNTPQPSNKNKPKHPNSKQLQLVQKKKQQKNRSLRQKIKRTISTIFLTQLVKKSPSDRFKASIMNLFEHSLNICIPALVVISHEVSYFVVITCVLVALATAFFRCFWGFSVKQRVFRGFKIVIFLVHHSSFFFMFAADKITFIQQQQVNQLCITLGIIVIFTVICGGGLQIIHIGLMILLTIIYKILNCFDRGWSKNKYRNNNEIIEQGLEKQNPIETRNQKLIFIQKINQSQKYKDKSKYKYEYKYKLMLKLKKKTKKHINGGDGIIKNRNRNISKNASGSGQKQKQKANGHINNSQDILNSVSKEINLKSQKQKDYLRIPNNLVVRVKIKKRANITQKQLKFIDGLN